MDQTKTEDDNAALEAREARRRRILENSNKRLTRLTGRVHNEEIPSAEPIVPVVDSDTVYPDPEMERDVYAPPLSMTSFPGFAAENQNVFELLKTMQGDGPLPGTQQQPQTPPVPETPISKFIRSKTPIVLIALLVYTLFAMNLEFLVGGAVFSALIVWEIFEFFITSFVITQPVQQAGLINLLFVFGGVSQQKAQLILKLLGLVNKILRDVAIFLFTFVVTHLLWSYLLLGESFTEILDKDFTNLLKPEE